MGSGALILVLLAACGSDDVVRPDETTIQDMNLTAITHHPGKFIGKIYIDKHLIKHVHSFLEWGLYGFSKIPQLGSNHNWKSG